MRGAPSLARPPKPHTDVLWAPGSEEPLKVRVTLGRGPAPSTCPVVDTAWHLPYGLPASAGMVLDDIGQTGCIPASQCACVYNGATYAPGAVYSTDCTNW